MIPFRFALPTLLVLLFTGLHPNPARADSVLSGTLANDADVFFYNFTNPASGTYSFFTTSYGGGTNVNGTSTAAGGFVPILTLFNASGTAVGYSSAGGAVASTGMADDALLGGTLAPGSYVLALSEFPNVPVGNLSNGFLFAGTPNITGLLCGSSGTFLQTDTTPCVQRSSAFTLDVVTPGSSPGPTVVPEPPGWVLVLPAAVLLACARRRFVV